MPQHYPRRGPSSDPELSGYETVIYSKDMLLALRGMALRQRHGKLAELLDAAAAEAERLATLLDALCSGE